MARKSARKTNKPVYNLQASDYLGKIESNVATNQSKLSMVLGALILIVVGILIYNYFSKSKPDLGPAQQTQPDQQQDVTPDKLPGKYTVKEGDTLFNIADKYYQDGYKYTEIAKANNLQNPDLLEAGQVLEIPGISVQPPPSAQPAVTASESKDSSEGSAMLEWGSKIEGTTYTVVEGDWLSKIAGRSYGDIYSYEKIAKANNIANPDWIEPGMVLTIPR